VAAAARLVQRPEADASSAGPCPSAGAAPSFATRIDPRDAVPIGQKRAVDDERRQRVVELRLSLFWDILRAGF
jgi:hypothetical protein